MHPLAAEHQALDEQARAYKREAQRLRAAAKRCRTRQAEVAEECRRRGIQLIEIPQGRSAPCGPALSGSRKAPG